MYESHARSVDLPGVGLVSVEVRVWRQNGRAIMQRLGICSYADGADLSREHRAQVRELIPVIR